MATGLCRVCGVEFEQVGRRRYCSDACKQRAYRKVGKRLHFIKIPIPKDAEKNDCVPISIAYATGKSFGVIKSWLVTYAREKRHNWRKNGFARKTYGPIISQLGFVSVPIDRWTLLSNCEITRDGVYLVAIKHHMFVVKDMCAHDTWDAQRKYLKRLTGLWRLA